MTLTCYFARVDRWEAYIVYAESEEEVRRLVAGERYNLIPENLEITKLEEPGIWQLEEDLP